MKLGSKIATLIATATAGTAFVAAICAGPAMAEGGGHFTSPGYHTVLGYTPGNSVGKYARPDVAGACAISVANPHLSGHNPGTINVTGTITCTENEASMTIAVTLWKVSCDPTCSDVQYGPTGTNSNFGRNNITTNSATESCTPGDYFGVATGTVVFPPGSTPPSGFLGKMGNEVSISC